MQIKIDVNIVTMLTIISSSQLSNFEVIGSLDYLFLYSLHSSSKVFMIIEAVCLHKIIIKILINEATNFGKVTVSLPFIVITWFMVTAHHDKSYAFPYQYCAFQPEQFIVSMFTSFFFT